MSLAGTIALDIPFGIIGETLMESLDDDEIVLFVKMITAKLEPESVGRLIEAVRGTVDESKLDDRLKVVVEYLRKSHDDDDLDILRAVL